MDIAEVESVAREHMATRREQPAREPGWLLYHGRRTGKIALQLADALDADVDRDILYAGALFHDIGKGADVHNAVGAALATEFLRDCCTASELASISELIALHNQRGKSAEHPVAVGLVQDADLIDHVGPMVPWLGFYWCGALGETIDDHVRFVTGEQNERYRTGMRENLNFDVSVRLFDARMRWEDNFLETFRRVYFEGVWP